MNETENLPLVGSMEYAMETSCTLKSIVRHHQYMKTGSGYDRTFPDVMMTFVFGWGKTNIQQVFRKEEMNAMKDEQLEAMRNDPTSAIFDYQVSSAERFKHVNNDMFMSGSQDSDSHSPLMVYIRSRSAARQRNFERSKEHLKKKQSGLSKTTKSTTSSTGAIQSNGKTLATRPGMITETMAVNPTAAAGGTADHLMRQPSSALVRPTEKNPTIDTRNFNQIDPHHQQDYSVRDQ